MDCVKNQCFCGLKIEDKRLEIEDRRTKIECNFYDVMFGF